MERYLNTAQVLERLPVWFANGRRPILFFANFCFTSFSASLEPDQMPARNKAQDRK